MKTKSVTTLILLFIALSYSKAVAQTVYIAETGKKYHTKNCDFVKKSKTALTLKEAMKKGYEACPLCGADKIVPNEEKKKKTEVPSKT